MGEHERYHEGQWALEIGAQAISEGKRKLLVSAWGPTSTEGSVPSEGPPEWHRMSCSLGLFPAFAHALPRSSHARFYLAGLINTLALHLGGWD